MRERLPNFEKPWFLTARSVLNAIRIEGGNVLDLCCGNAEFSQILRDEYKTTVVSADYSETHLVKARELGFETFCVDFDAPESRIGDILDRHRERYDLVVNLAAIEHIFDTNSLLRFCHGVLKPGGSLLVSTPNIAFAAYRFHSIVCGNRPFGEGHHVRFFDYDFLRLHLWLNGFDPVIDGRRFMRQSDYAVGKIFGSSAFAQKFWRRAFGLCRYGERLPFLKNLCTDELTILARKENVPPIGFPHNVIRERIAKLAGTPDYDTAVSRLKEAQRRGWLRRHAGTCEYARSL